MIKIKSVTMKNFLSVGAVTQSVDLTKTGITLVLGENLDLGGNGSRNGVGKSTLLQAISYGLFGLPLTNIKKDNLVNKVNQKSMSVSINFENNGHSYTIERGRKPAYFRYVVDNDHVNSQDTDEAQGENRDTQSEIEKILGMSHTMFKYIVGLNTYSEPFLSLGAGKQRELIEELLSITTLSQKSEKLKELIKTSKQEIEKEELKLRTIKLSNERIERSIAEVIKKQDAWHTQHDQEIETLEAAIAKLAQLDIDAELEMHKNANIYNELTSVSNQFKKDIALKSRHVSQLETQLNSLLSQYNSAMSKECPMCGQGLKDHSHANIIESLENKISVLDNQISTEKNSIADCQSQLDQVTTALSDMAAPNTFYSSFEQALGHKNTIDTLVRDLEKEKNRKNPYDDQYDSMQETIQPIDYAVLNGLVHDREHQEFLLKLLTNKDSFIRKRIIDQNLAYLNTRLHEYLDKLGLPHQVKFLNDLTTEISIFGQDLDFFNLSRGESNRLILGLSLSFRDIFENTNTAMNLLFIDELLDNGLDQIGLENCVEVLKNLSRERNKNIYLISHRDELVNRSTSVLSVVKESGFTWFNDNYESDT
jgi:DNA repair exonuclease SbcCD ATPase subunit